MERLIVEGGYALRGEIVPAGNKNSAQPMLAACLLTDEPVTLHNVPDIDDVRILLSILSSMGVEVDDSRLPEEDHTIVLQARRVDTHPDRELGARVRGSILMAGPLLARTGHAVLGQPGGDSIGWRRIDTHLLALKALGVSCKVEGDQYLMRADKLRGAEI